MSPESAVEMLVQFSRMLSGSNDPAEILPLLALNVVDVVGAEAAAVLQVAGTGEAHLVASHGLPDALSSWYTEFETITSELGDEIVEATGGRFAQGYTLPLVASGDLFGAIVLLFGSPRRISPDELHLAEGFVDLAALALSKAYQLGELLRSNHELRASREVLQQSEKLRALGQMAAGISHDLKNILNPLSLQLQLFKRRVKKDPAAADEIVHQIEDVVMHGLQTVERLRAFSRQSPELSVEPVDVDKSVDEAVELCRPRLRMARSELRLVVEQGAPSPVLVNSADLLNSLVNLIINAVDAMADGGVLTVRTGQAPDGGAVWVEVSDTGCGIPEELQRRVFEPFFTTKGKEGTGLGLAMVYAFAQRHGGNITLDSGPGLTRFRLFFPPTHRPGVPAIADKPGSR